MKRLALATLIFAIVGAACFAVWRFIPPSRSFYTDANSIKEPVGNAQVRDVLWEPPTLLLADINAPGETYEPRLSNDGTTMYFVRGKAGQNADIFLAKRTAAGWSVPESIAEINSPADELGPEISGDAASLYFYSNRAGGQGGYDLWVSRRSDDAAWREPVNLGPGVNSQFNDYGPALTRDGRTLYFSSNRPLPGDERQPDPNAWPATLREEFFSRTYDLYFVPVTESGMGDARPLAALNTASNEGAPAVGAFGDFLYFASDRPGGAGGFDLYRSRRLRGEHLQAENLGTALNTASHELDPALSMNGFGLDFSSNRPIAGQAPAASPEYKLYHTNSREVFVDSESLERPPFDWAALWRAVGPNLLWALLALALLLLMLLLFKGAQDRRLSLLAKCVLASLVTHLLLMLLFNVWEVAASLAGEFRRGKTIQVALAGPSSDSVAAQITGSLSQIETRVVEMESVRAAMNPEPVAPPMQSDFRPDPKKIEWSARVEPAPATDAAAAPAMPAVPEVVPAPQAARAEFAPSIPDVSRAQSIPESQSRHEASAASASRVESSSQAVEANDFSRIEFSPARSNIQPVQAAVSQVGREVRDAATVPTAVEHAAPHFPPELSNQPVTLAAHLPDAPPGREETEPASAPRPLESLSSPSPKASHTVPLQTIVVDAASTLPPARAEVAVTPTRPGSIGLTIGDSPAAAQESPEWTAPGIDLKHRENYASFTLPEPGETQARGKNPEATTAAVLPKVLEVSRADVSAPVSVETNSAPRMNYEFGRAALASSSNTQRPALTEAARDAQISRSMPVEDSPSALSPATSPAMALELNLPVDLAPPENPYPQRTADDRLESVKRMGGSEETEAAVALALDWLARHQSPDGHWDADGFDERCGDCDGQTDIAADHALTGLGLLCFLGAGHTHTEAGPYQDNVRRALSWLAAKQKEDGDLRGGKETMYTQGIATIALAESYAMTADAALADSVQRAVRFIHRARNPQTGGWRYDPGQAGDTSVLGWQVMALKSAARAGVPVPEEAFMSARRWLDKVSRDRNPGLYSYQPGEKPTPSMTAEALFAQQLLGLTPTEPRMIESVEFLLDHLPDWEREAPTYFWYYASLALFQHQGEAWKNWNAALSRELIDHQRRDGGAAGSWNPSDEWSELGGRVYQTAICTLMLEVYYRYLPMYGQDALAVKDMAVDAPAPDDIVGTIRGTVTDRSTRSPLSDALVRLVLSDRDTLVAKTDANGKYALEVPATPDHFALSASLEGFVPLTANVERARLEKKKKLTVNFLLEPGTPDALVTETAPDVHHLGDDRFSGDINSQFQKKSEGSKFSIEFAVASEALAVPLQRAEVRLLAKGVQRRHKLYINDKLLNKRMDDAPEDGGFGEFVAPFDPGLITVGANTFRIEALPSTDDIDDFEFVNIRIYLVPLAATPLDSPAPIPIGTGPAGTH